MYMPRCFFLAPSHIDKKAMKKKGSLNVQWQDQIPPQAGSNERALSSIALSDQMPLQVGSNERALSSIALPDQMPLQVGSNERALSSVTMFQVKKKSSKLTKSNMDGFRAD
jgi:hypothetical protein